MFHKFCIMISHCNFHGPMECIYDIIIRPLKELEPTPGNLDETLSQAVFSIELEWFIASANLQLFF